MSRPKEIWLDSKGRIVKAASEELISRAPDPERMSKVWTKYIECSAYEKSQAQLAIATKALQQIGTGKLPDDMDNAQIMAGRFWRTAQDALSEIQKLSEGGGE